MLKVLRVGISIVLFTLITFLFLDFAQLLPNEFHALAHLQLIPAILGSSLFILLFLLVLTLLFGRIYCSTLCPMGVFQDVVSWLSKRIAKKKKRYKYSKAKTILRWSVLIITFIAFFAGFTLLLALVDPYSAYGRVVVNVFKPVYLFGNNILESIFTSFGNYSFYKVEVSIIDTPSFIIALVTLLVICFLAWKYGRTFCNTICPVGTILGFVSRFSFFKVRIDNHKCNGCGLCATKCKASCIDSKTKTIDYSRCVDCFNCLSSCKQNALSFAPRRTDSSVRRRECEPVDTEKRQFLITAVASVATIPSLMAGTKLISGENGYTRQIPISPPGAKSTKRLLHHCTSCHLCISRCPSNVLKPTFMEYGLGGMMQPMMYFEKGFCNYDCTVCSDVCPNGALIPMSVEQKHLEQVGRVVFNEDICVVHTEGTNCGACAEHCPTQAVTMIPYKDGLTIPSINANICVGCGGCEFICPVRPHRAIFVEGNAIHQKAEAFVEEKKEDIVIDDFGF